MDFHEKLINSTWYKEIIFYLRNLECPGHLNKNQRRKLKLVSQKYIIANYGLAWINHR